MNCFRLRNLLPLRITYLLYADSISVTAVSLVLHALHIKGERNTYGVNRLGSKRRAVTELKGTLH